MLGYTEEELLSMNFFQINPQYSEEEWPVRWKNIKNIKAMTVESSHRTKDGRFIPVEVSGNFIEYEGTEYIVSFARDISERQQLQEKVSQYESEIRQMFERSPVGIFRTTADGQVVISNPSILEMMGFATIKELNKVGLPNLYENPNDRLKLLDMLKKNKSAELETRIKRSDGEVIDIKLNAYPIFASNGELLFLEGNIQDISRVKQIERELSQAVSEKEILIRDIHHRVKNNMALVINFLNLEMEEVESGRNTDIVNSYKNSISRIFILSEIYSLLYQTDQSPERADCAEFFSSLIGLIRSLYPDEKDVSVACEIENIELPLRIMIPLGLMINEIISNSFKYAFPGNREGNIFIELTENESGIHLSIRDDGVGISGDYTELKQHSLGIRLIENFVSQLDGECSVDTSDGVGYSIYFTRP